MFLFTLKKLTNIILTNSSINIILHNTYYIITHFHYILSIKTIFTIFTNFTH
ncbi:hypothetical protein [Erythrobacter sanguineus]|uniref:hypothetical protein n=1 Tax=Erythrobacter sanguineus TaxID=198312 RepID=UPI003D160225